MDDPADTLGVMSTGTGAPVPASPPPPVDASALPEPAAPAGTGLMATPDAAGSSAGVSRAPVAGTQLETTHGRTTIADAVVARTAARAVLAIEGVHSFGRPAARALAAASGRLTGGRAASTDGVTVEVGDGRAAIDVTVVVDHGTPIAPLADALRAHVVRSVETVTGLDVLEVDIHVADLR